MGTYTFEFSQPGRKTWQQSQNYAKSKGGRLPTLSEAKQILTTNGKPTNLDMWVPVGTDNSDKDWVQIGTHPSVVVGSSHK